MAVSDLCSTSQHLFDRVERLLKSQATHPCERILIALAGAPGSGKTSVSSALLAQLEAAGIRDVAVVPMDGFHYSQDTLRTFPDPDAAFRRRGAPFTFDVDGLLQLVTALKRVPVTKPGEPSVIIRAPSFDHAKKDPVADDFEIPSTTRVAIVEGLYTLLDVEPWNRIAEMADETWFVDVPVELARERLIARHIQAGIETSRESAARRAEENDLKNGELIKARLIKPDFMISN